MRRLLGGRAVEEGASWVAYSGPGDERAEPCLDRMTVAHKSDDVTCPARRSEARAECQCELLAPAGPRLGPGKETDPEMEIWVRALQSVLHHRRTPPRSGADRPHEGDVTGIYDGRTGLGGRLLEANGERPTGITDTFVWDRLIRTGCSLRLREDAPWSRSPGGPADTTESR